MIMKDFMSALSDGRFDGVLNMLYGDSSLEIMKQRIRLTDACEHFSKAYPYCDDIKVVSVPAVTEIVGIPVFLSADKIIIKGNGHDVEYVSDNIPKGFRIAKSQTTEDIADCFTGYSICFSGVKKKISKKRTPDSDYDMMCRLIEENKKVCEKMGREALKLGDTASFFHDFSHTQSYLICNYKTQIGIMKSRSFIGRDGAVAADDNYITAFVPSYREKDYIAEMDGVFGDGNCVAMRLRSQGAFEIAT